MATDELTKLKGKRHVYRRHLKTLDEELSTISPDSVHEDDGVKLLTLRKNYVSKLELIKILDEEILNVLTVQKEMEDELSEFLVINDRLDGQVVKMDNLLKKLDDRPSRAAVEEEAKTSVITRKVPQMNPVKLPKLEISKFDGSVLNWCTFWERFSASIDLREDISEIEKFNYLLGLLTENAKSCIAGLSLTSANYRQAKIILKERFANPQAIVSAHMDSIVKLPKVKSMSQLFQLRKMYDHIENCIRNLSVLDINPSSYGALLIPVLTEKLPDELRVMIARKFGDVIWDLTLMIGYFKEELQARERCSAISVNRGERDSSYNSEEFTTSAFMSENKNVCVYCRDVHAPSRWSKITEIKARRGILRKYARCFICLRKSHISKTCTSSYKCHKCNQRHHISICDEQNRKQYEEKNGDIKKQEYIARTSNNFTDNRNNILLQTAVGHASCVGNQHYRKIRLMFDSGSQRTYITRELRDCLKLPKIRTENLVIQTFGGFQSKVERVDIVQLKLCGNEPNPEIYIEAICIPTICSPLQIQTFDIMQCQGNYDHLVNLNFADYKKGDENLEIDILIGVDFYFSLINGEIKKGVNGPVALKSIFGWVLCGKYEACDDVSNLTIAHNTTHCLRILNHSLCETETLQPSKFKHRGDKDGLHDLVKTFFDVENLGVDDNYTVVEDFKRNLTFDGEKYVCRLPLKKHHDFIPDNYRNSLNRLKSLHVKLGKNPELLKKYDDVIQGYLEDGIVEKISEPGEEGKVHYLPHRPVVKEERETTKVRIVMDASSKINRHEPSLNECLYSGPCLLPLIYDILLRFRMGRIGIIGDIQQAFLSIAVAEDDRVLLRFLWFENISGGEPKIIILRFTRALLGLTSSPFLFNGTIAFHVNKYIIENNYVEILKKLLRDRYVDDVTVGVDTFDEGYHFYHIAKSCLKEGGFTLRKWATNDKRLQKVIEKEEGNISNVDDVTYARDTLGTDCLKDCKKVLGINWDNSRDKFVFEISKFGVKGLELKCTKRNILKISASFFDPLGFISPIVLQAKLLFKDLCKLKYDWDTILKNDFSNKWYNYLNDLKNTDDIRIPRYVFYGLPQKQDLVELHGFADSSKDAYAAVVYCRIKLESGEFQTYFLSGKSRVAPEKIISIPRLELMSCLLLSKLVCSVKEAIKYNVSINRIICWSDSEVALHWIKGIKKEWKAWVENRVNIIRSNVNKEFWKHVPGENNPADLATRAGKIIDLICDRWWNGPEFLRSEETSWPGQVVTADKLMVLAEMKNSHLNVVEHLTLQVNSETGNSGIDTLIDETGYNSFQKLCRVTAYVLLFLYRMKGRIVHLEADSELTIGKFRITESVLLNNSLTVNEVNNAEFIWLQHAQKQFYEKGEIKQLKTCLRLYEDENNLLRSRTRLIEADGINEEAKFPVILPNDSHISKLVIMDAHEEVRHTSVDSTLNRVRSRYWILRGRRAVSKVVAKCSLCKIWRLRRLKATPLANLPNYRICSEYSFQVTGIDYAGPLLVRNIYGDKQNLYKSYILLFTCATSRAVHIELTADMSASTLIRTLKRFFCRKGYPERIISDNFTSFKSKAVKAFLLRYRIEWKFILELSPWWGGFYERLIKVVKNSLRKILKNARLTYDELSTVLIEIESIMNSRPLTYLSEDGIEAITPFHLLHGRNILVRGGRSISEIMYNKENTESRVKHLKFLLSQFWKRFYNEYTLSLRERMLYDKTNRGTKDFVLDDVVIIVDDKTKPTHWKKGRIIGLIKGRDSIVRGVRLQTTTPTGKLTQISRPVQKIIPLEIAPTNNEKFIDTEQNLADDSYETEDDYVNEDDNSNDSRISDIANDYDNTNISNDPCDLTNEALIDSGRSNENFNDSRSSNDYERPRRNAAIIGEINRRFHMKK